MVSLRSLKYLFKIPLRKFQIYLRGSYGAMAEAFLDIIYIIGFNQGAAGEGVSQGVYVFSGLCDPRLSPGFNEVVAQCLNVPPLLPGREIRDKLNEHQMIVGWYSKGFDLPFLNTRLTRFGMKGLDRHFHLDLMWTCRGWHGIKPRNAKLSTVAEFFNLEERKMDVDVEIWARASRGDKRSINILVHRCESDVRLLEQIYWKMLPFVTRLERYGR